MEGGSIACHHRRYVDKRLAWREALLVFVTHQGNGVLAMKESLRRILQTIRLPRFVVEWLDHRRESSGKVIEKALVEHYDIPTPEDYEPPEDEDDL